MVRDFLRHRGFEEAALAGTSTTYLVTDAVVAPRQLIGYVTLSLTQIRLTESEKKKGQQLATVKGGDFGAIRIGMIGVDRRFAGRGYGKVLMDAVIAHTAQMSREVSVRFIVADAVNTQLSWYQRRGFVENRSDSEHKRLARGEENTGVRATSMRLDLGPDPRKLL